MISVTSFFRDAEVFDALKTQILPAILKEVGEGGEIRIWVAGCSTGEEAYSLAILLQELLGNRIGEYHIQIFGTDLSERAIQHARAGVYRETIGTHVSPERLKRFFVAADGGYRIEKSVRDMCIFARHNLASDPPFSQIPLGDLQKSAHYLQPVLQKRIIPFQELSSDVSNLLHSTRIPVVMLDKGQRIRRVTPMADRLLKVVPSDIDRQIADIRLNIDVPDLATLITTVLDTLLPIERELRDLAGH